MSVARRRRPRRVTAHLVHDYHEIGRRLWDPKTTEAERLALRARLDRVLEALQGETW